MCRTVVKVLKTINCCRRSSCVCVATLEFYLSTDKVEYYLPFNWCIRNKTHKKCENKRFGVPHPIWYGDNERGIIESVKCRRVKCSCKNARHNNTKEMASGVWWRQESTSVGSLCLSFAPPPHFFTFSRANSCCILMHLCKLEILNVRIGVSNCHRVGERKSIVDRQFRLNQTLWMWKKSLAAKPMQNALLDTFCNTIQFAYEIIEGLLNTLISSLPLLLPWPFVSFVAQLSKSNF